MRPFGKISGAAAGPNPLTNPEDVTDALMLEVPASVSRQTARYALQLGLFTRLADNTLAAGNVVVAVFVLDESNLGPADKTARVFRQLGAQVTIGNSGFGVQDTPPGSAASPAHRIVPPPGQIYIQVISGQEAGLEVVAVLS